MAFSQSCGGTATGDGPIAHAKILIIEGEYHTRKTLRALLLSLDCSKILTKQATARAVSRRSMLWLRTSFCSTGNCRAWAEQPLCAGSARSDFPMRACPSSCWSDVRSAPGCSRRFGSGYTNFCSSRSRAARSRPVFSLCWATHWQLRGATGSRHPIRASWQAEPR